MTNIVTAWRSVVPLPIRDAIARTRRQLSPDAGTPYYSGNGEDAVVVSWFRYFNFDVTRVRYLDIGAAYPTRMSNTFMLYRLGARGVLIEPDPDQAASLRDKRPRDIVVNAGAAFDHRDSATFFRLTTPVFNTFSREHAELAVTHQRATIVETIDVSLVPINDVIARHFDDGAPHFISIDTEGCDFAILKSLNLDLLPREAPCLICVEGGATPEEYRQVLAPHGFELTATMPTNLLFLRQATK